MGEKCKDHSVRSYLSRRATEQYPVSREIIELYNRLYGCPGDMDE